MKRRYGIAGAVVACVLSLAVAQSPPAATNTPSEFDTNSEPKVVQPAQIDLSPTLDEVVRLAQSGAQENVIVAYVQKAPAYAVSADEIIYLQDLGISDTVIKAVVEHGQIGAVATTLSPAPAPNVPAVPTPAPASPTSTAPVVVAPPLTPPANVAEFYQPLSPYGTWVIVEPYGWCWQPNVVSINAGWSPYCDNGYWLWSDSGWYWHSYYSWGWAPFHYGRWFYHPQRHWCWMPDRVWGPSWVCWRETPGYYGWAPLPPGARFSVGIGWTFGGSHVGPNFAFGLSSAHFTFVAGQHFGDRRLAAHRLPPREVNVVYEKTTVINNYTVGPGNRIINRGVERRHVEATTGRQFPEVAVKELPRQPARASSTVRPDRVTKVGASDVIYRPGAKIQVPRKPAPAVASQKETLIRPEAPIHGRTPPAQQNNLPTVTPVPRQTPRQPVPTQPDRTQARPQSPSTAPQRIVPPNQPAPVTPAPLPRTAPSQPAPARPAPSRPPQGHQNPGEKADRVLLPNRHAVPLAGNNA
jgi:Family of unknown function (DUF6600)